MSKLNKTSLKNELFLFVLFNHMSKGAIEFDEVNNLAQFFNYENNIIDDFINNDVLCIKANRIILATEIINEIENEFIKYSSKYTDNKMGQAQKKFLKNIDNNRIELKKELKENPNAIDIILPLVKGKYISINSAGYIVKQM